MDTYLNHYKFVDRTFLNVWTKWKNETKKDKMFAEILNYLHIGKHTEHDIKILLTWQVFEENLQQLQEVPWFYPTKQIINDYNKYILENASEYTVTKTPIDIPPSDISSSIQQQLLETALHHKCVETTGDLPNVLQVTLNKQYDIIANISIDNGLLNGAHCCIKYR